MVSHIEIPTEVTPILSVKVSETIRGPPDRI